MMPRGSVIADPGAQNRYQFSMMPRGSVVADPGAQNRYQFSMMPRGSVVADPGAQNRYQFSIPIPCCNTGTVFCFNTGTVKIFFDLILVSYFCFNTGTVFLFQYRYRIFVSIPVPYLCILWIRSQNLSGS
jgi:hypothetical protein